MQELPLPGIGIGTKLKAAGWLWPLLQLWESHPAALLPSHPFFHGGAQGHRSESTLAPGTSSPWGDSKGGERPVCPHLQDLSALWSSPAWVSPAASYSGGFPARIVPRSRCSRSARRGDTVHICRLFALSPSPRGRTLCNGLSWFVLFSLCVYTCFYICVCGNMDTDIGLGFPAFAFPPTHRLIPLGTLLSPQQ